MDHQVQEYKVKLTDKTLVRHLETLRHDLRGEKGGQ
jgi:hypothetical protein